MIQSTLSVTTAFNTPVGPLAFHGRQAASLSRGSWGVSPLLRPAPGRQSTEHVILALRTSPSDDGKYPKSNQQRKRQRNKPSTSRSFRSGTSSEDISSVEIEKMGGGGPWSEDDGRVDMEFEREGGREGSLLGESFWMDYVMRVTTDQAEKPQETPTKRLEALEAKLKQGEISESKYDEQKQELMKAFWASLVEDKTIARSFKQQDINVQVCNSKQFADSWLRMNVIEPGETLVGLAVEWNSKWRVKGAKARSRISTIQVSTAQSVLIIQMSLLKPLTPPKLLQQVLSDPRIRKVGTRVLSDSLKLKKDWRLSVIGRVDAAALSEELKYLEGTRSRNTSTIAKQVLALDYEKPRQVALGNWEAESLSDLQITCGALDAWVPRAAVAYLESLTGSKPTVADITPPSAALARGGKQTGLRPQQRRGKGAAGDAVEVAQEEEEEAKEEGAEPEVLGEPDLELYLPLVDVRRDGSCAHWLWRGTRVSDQHIARYCNVKVEVDENEWSSCTRVRLWGEPQNVREAGEWVRKLLAKSQIEEEYRELGLSAPAYIEAPLAEDQYQATALVNTPELVSWSFFPMTLTETFTGDPVPVRGNGGSKDRQRAAFFSSANAADKAADAILGKHRPSTVEGPLPGGLDPAVMWRVSGYTL